jgi:hypothetical protein
MLIEPKNAIIIEPNALKYPVAIKQTMVENRNLCLALIIEASVDIDFEVHIGLSLS